MNDFYTNMNKEIKIIKHSLKHHYGVTMQLCTKNCVMFTVPEKHLEEMQKFCQEQSWSCEPVEQIGSNIMCKVV